MERFRLDLEYDGSAFCGWQKQPGQRSVQGTIERALERIARQPVEVTGAGRTDRGVHATCQVAHFELPRLLDTRGIGRALRGLLPTDIRVRGTVPAAPGFHARFSARCRRYVYLIARRPSALRSRYAWTLERDLDLERMNQAARLLLGVHDLRGFAVGGDDPGSGVCRVRRAGWTRVPLGWRFLIEADRFLRRVVRMLVGVMVEIGTERRGLEAMTAPLAGAAGERRAPAAPAAGLYLAGVGYETAGWIERRQQQAVVVSTNAAKEVER